MCLFFVMFYSDTKTTHALIGVCFPAIIISGSKLHVKHRLLFKVKTTTGMIRMHWLVLFHEKLNTFQTRYEESRSQRKTYTLGDDALGGRRYEEFVPEKIRSTLSFQSAKMEKKSMLNV